MASSIISACPKEIREISVMFVITFGLRTIPRLLKKRTFLSLQVLQFGHDPVMSRMDAAIALERIALPRPRCGGCEKVMLYDDLQITLGRNKKPQ